MLAGHVIVARYENKILGLTSERMQQRLVEFVGEPEPFGAYRGTAALLKLLREPFVQARVDD
ncbi:MAG TPA: hypothetical protein VM434_10710 [Beijerinckiaceae bacterium]|nr:hypothetical protein [Beijerinckiaceae bacterium]